MYAISNNRYFRLILERNHRGSPPEHSGETTSATHLQAKQHRPHIQRMQTGPCRNIETFGRAKVRVRGKTQRIRERREGGKAVERTSAPAETYPSRKLTGKKLRRHILKVKTAPCNKIKTCGRAKIRVREKPQQVSERHEGCKAK